MAKDFQEVRQEILTMHARVQEENFYELLEIPPDADGPMIGGKFRGLARTWHIDRFSAYDLGVDKPKVQEIFSVLNTAHKTLTNSDRRAEYDLTLDDGPDISEILTAESHFRSGKSRLQGGHYKGAHEAFRQASELQAEEPEYKAHLIYTEYLLIEKDENGRVMTRARAKEIMEELDAINVSLQEKGWLLSFLGTVALGLGKDGEAEGLFKEALLQDANDTSAKRQLRLIRTRRKRKNNRGFFAKLFGK